MTREEIETKYMGQIRELEQEFFDYNDDGNGTLVRTCKKGKTEEEFNIQQGLIYKAMEQELIEKGYISPPQAFISLEPSVEEYLIDLDFRLSMIELRLT